MASYIALIHKESASQYGVSFPDFPGCITAGETLDEAKDMASEALGGHVATMRDFDEPIPEPSTLQKVMADPENTSAAVLVVPLHPARAKIVRVNVTLSEEDLHATDEAARRHGMTRSGFLRRAAQKAINEPLSQRGIQPTPASTPSFNEQLPQFCQTNQMASGIAHCSGRWR